MKYLCTALILIFLPIGIYAQNIDGIDRLSLNDQESLISLTEHNLGGIGGSNVKANFVGRDLYFVLLGGSYIGIMVKPSVSVFASVNYLMSDLDGLEAWYTGIGAEYIFSPDNWFQIYVSGQLSYGRMNFLHEGISYQSGVFVFEPEFLTGIRLFKYAWLKGGVGYRIATGISGLPIITNKNSSGWYAVYKISYGAYNPQERKKVLHSKERLTILSGNYSVKFTGLNHQLIILDSYGAGFIFNRKFEIGFSLYRPITNVIYNNNELFIDYNGVCAHYIASPISRLHFSAGALVASGEVYYRDKITKNNIDVFTVVFEPDIFLDINITEFMRLGFGVGYRFVPTTLETLNFRDLSGFTGAIQIGFGGF